MNRLKHKNHNAVISRYLSDIGRKGGKISKRQLDPETARLMVKVRESKKAFRKYYAQCFWSFDPELHIGAEDIEWVSEQLIKNGSREAWELGKRLCQ